MKKAIKSNYAIFYNSKIKGLPVGTLTLPLSYYVSEEIVLSFTLIICDLWGQVVKVSRFEIIRPSPLRSESHMRGSCQLLTEGCWFTPRINQFHMSCGH